MIDQTVVGDMGGLKVEGFVPDVVDGQDVTIEFGSKDVGMGE